MLARYAQVVALAVGDDEDGAFLGEVRGLYQQVHTGLQHGAATAFEGDALGDVGGRQIAQVVRCGVAADQAHGGNNRQRKADNRGYEP